MRYRQTRIVLNAKSTYFTWKIDISYCSSLSWEHVPVGKKPDTCIQEYFLSTTAYNNPVHNARKCTNSLNPLCRLCQDLINNKCPKHLSFLITIFTVSLLMICHSLVCILFIFVFTRKNSRIILDYHWLFQFPFPHKVR